MTEDKTVRCHHQLNGHESDQAPGDGEGQRSLVGCSPWDCKESDMTEQLNKFNSVQFKEQMKKKTSHVLLIFFESSVNYLFAIPNHITSSSSSKIYNYFFITICLVLC